MLSKIGKLWRAIWVHDKDVPLPEPSFESVFSFVRQRAKGYVRANQLPSIHATDQLVGKHRFGRDDITYFAMDIERDLGLDIPKEEWRRIYTFGELTDLLVKHLKLKRRATGSE